MRKNWVKALLGGIVVLLFACAKPAQETKTSSNPEIDVQLLFENDGCKMYRFYDGGRAVYYSDCRGRVQSSYRVKTGKNSHTTKYRDTETIE